jgi:hypothetical protein
MSTRDDVRRELKELAKLAETIRSRKEPGMEAPPSSEWSALATTDELTSSEALALAPPRPSSATVPPVSASRPSVPSAEALGGQNQPLYRRRPALLTLAAGAALVCAVAGSAAVGRSVSTKPPVAARPSALEEVAVRKPTTASPMWEPAAMIASPAKPAAAEPLPNKTQAAAASASSPAAFRPPPRPASAKTSARPASSAEQSLDDLIRKAVAAPAR